MEKSMKIQVGYEQAQSAYASLLKLRVDTEKCANEIIGLLKADAFIDQENADNMLACVQEMTSMQDQICAFLKQNNLVCQKTMSGTLNAITAYEKKQAETVKKQEIIRSLKQLLTLTYTGDDKTTKTTIEKVKQDVQKILDRFEQLADFVAETQKYLDLLGLVEESQVASVAVDKLIGLLQSFGQIIGAVLMLAIQAKALIIKERIVKEEVEEKKNENSDLKSTTPDSGNIDTTTDINITEKDESDIEEEKRKVRPIVLSEDDKVIFLSNAAFNHTNEEKLAAKNLKSKAFIQSFQNMFSKYQFSDSMNLFSNIANQGYYSCNFDFDKFRELRIESNIKDESNLLEKIEAILKKYTEKGYLNRYVFCDDVFYTLSQTVIRICQKDTVHSYLKLAHRIDAELSSLEADDFDRFAIKFYLADRIRSALQDVKFETEVLPFFPVVSGTTLKVKRNNPYRLVYIPLVADQSTYKEDINDLYEQIKDNYKVVEQCRNFLVIVSDKLQSSATFKEYFKDLGFDDTIVFKVSGKEVMPLIYDEQGNRFDFYQFFEDVLRVEDEDVQEKKDDKTLKISDKDTLPSQEQAVATGQEDIARSATLVSHDTDAEKVDTVVSKTDNTDNNEEPPVVIEENESLKETVQDGRSEHFTNEKTGQKETEMVIISENDSTTGTEVVDYEAPSLPTPKIEEKLLSKEEIKEILEKVNCQLGKQRIAETMILLHGLRKRTTEAWAKELCEETGYILSDPLQLNQSDGFRFIDTLLEIPGINNEVWPDYFITAVYIRSFFKPVNFTVNDYRLKQHWGRIKEDNSNIVFRKVPKVKELIGYFKTFAEKTRLPFSACLNSKVLDNERISNKKKTIYEKVCLEKVRLSEDAKKNKIRNERIHTFHNVLFGNNGDISRYFEESQLSDLTTLRQFCQTFTDINLSEVNDISILDHKDLLSQEAVDQFIDDKWTEVKTINSKKKMTNRLTGSARTGVNSTMTRALNVLVQYVICSQLMADQEGAGLSAEQAQLERKKASEILLDIRPVLSNLKSNYFMDEFALNCLKTLINVFIQSMDVPEESNEHYYDSFLKTGYIEMEGNLPDIQTDFKIPEFDLYSRCVKHISAIDGNASLQWHSVYQYALNNLNLGICQSIKEKYSDYIENEKDDFVIPEKELPRYIDNQFHEFMGDLELAYNYGQIIDRTAFEKYVEYATKARDHFKGTKNLGLFNLFVRECKNDISKAAELRRQEMQSRFAKIKEALKEKYNADNNVLDQAERSSLGDNEYVENMPIVRQIQECLDDNNLTVVEDYMNLWEKENYTKIPDNVSVYHGTFERFTVDYQSYFDICSRSKSFTMNKIWDFNKGNSIFSVFSGKQKKGAETFLAEFAKIGMFSPVNVKELLKHLSFYDETCEDAIEVKEKSKISSNSVVYQVKFKKKPKVKESYPTPFEVFGTGIYKRGLQVFVFTGKHSAQNIINELERASLEHDTGTICFVDYAMPLADRRETAATIKKSSNLQNIIIIDRVMALYLAPIEKLERKNKLLQLALPFAFVQPYLSDTSAMAAEMFIGRTDELRKIKDMKGPVLVYGGRQLGKSALLRQVSYIEHYPKENSYAYFIDIKQKDSKGTLRAVSETLKLGGLLKKIPQTWDEFSYEIKALLSEASKVKIKKLLLLIDEADTFLVSAAKEQNIPIEILKNIKDTSDGRFKFVLAGLHNVIRYDKQHLAGNSVYAHLGHVLVKPFEFTDASELLSKPLSYLGFQIKTPAMMSTIFSQANYFPGLIQFYCYKLVEAVKENYLRGNFNAIENPPYVLDENYLKNVLLDKQFLENIEEKFIITLKLDEDNYYDIIALAVAYYYHQNKSEVTLEDIYNCCEDLDISKIAEMEDTKLEALLDEMIELNILRKDENGNYGFNRYSFFNMMGKNVDEIVDKLIKYAG